MCDWATKCSASQLWIHSSTRYQITTTEKPDLMPTTDLELTMSSGWTHHEREDPIPLYREGTGIWWLSTRLPKLCGPKYWWNDWGTAKWVACSSLLLKAVEGAAIQCTPGMGHGPSPGAHMPAMGILHRVTGLQSPMVKPPLVNMAATWEPKSKHHNKHQHTTMNWWRLNSKKEDSPEEDPWHIWHIPEKALGLRMSLLWHSGKANRALHCFPQDQLWWRNHIMLTHSC